MKVNVKARPSAVTHEGAPARRINALQMLKRSVLSCMLWENEFYEDGQTISERIKDLIPSVDPQACFDLAVKARTDMKLRHVPLLIARTMAALGTHKYLVSRLLATIIQRPDELTEFLAIYWKEKRQPLSAQVKKGLALAFAKFDEYSLAKYNRENAIKLRDVLFLSHARPSSTAQEVLWKKLIANELAIPDTWEVELSQSKDKKASWTRLLTENKLGGLALLRNLRNIKEAGVAEPLIARALVEMRVDRILPFRFITAARYAPQWESKIEGAMLKCLNGLEKLPGKTVLLVDVSGSMSSNISAKSELSRQDAAEGLAILARELCEEIEIFSFSDTFVRIPDRHGFGLRDAIRTSQRPSGTYLGAALIAAKKVVSDITRIIVITDEQSHDAVGNPHYLGYMINVASNENGVGYGPWHHIDGWSEAVFDYIIENEKEGKE
jgi:60 kDa SS-A/Ro ribonucleoprotein